MLQRWGISLTLVGQRAFMLCGWKRNSAVTRSEGGGLVLDLEQDHERVRRLADEFTAKLERER